MAAITAGLVKELRERTGAGMLDCKKHWSNMTEILKKQLTIYEKRNCESSKESRKNCGRRIDFRRCYCRS